MIVRKGYMKVRQEPYGVDWEVKEGSTCVKKHTLLECKMLGYWYISQGNTNQAVSGANELVWACDLRYSGSRKKLKGAQRFDWVLFSLRKGAFPGLD